MTRSHVANRTAIPKRLQVAVFRRDGWLCCWCKRPVIFAPVMGFLEREIRVAGKVDPLAYHHAHWTRHGAPLLVYLARSSITSKHFRLAVRTISTTLRPPATS